LLTSLTRRCSRVRRMTTVGEHVLADDAVEGHVFDIDGTFIDTMPGFLPSWVTVCAQYDMEMTEQRFFQFAGVPLPDIVKTLFMEQKGAVPEEAILEEFLAEKLRTEKEYAAQKPHPPGIQCVIDIARSARKKGIPIACATSGIREVVDTHMAALGLDELFEHVVCVGELPPGRGKPHPDVYLEAARRIGVDPTKCRAYEDGETGMQSAYAAGMHVIDVRDFPGYPLCDGLKIAMENERAAGYSWLKQEP